MSKSIIRPASLILTLLVAVAAACIQDSQMALASDPTQYPAVVRVKTANGDEQLVTYARTLIEAIDAAGIKVGEHDDLNLPDDTPLQPGQAYQVTLTRMNQVTLNWSGFAVNTAGRLSSMGELMSRSGFSDLDLSDGSRIVNSKPDPADQDELALTYVNVDKRIARVYEPIPFSTITVDDPTIYIGKSVVREAGQEGERALVYEETYENGILINTEQTGIEIVREPIQRVISQGTKVRIVYYPINRRTVGTTVLNSLSKISGLLHADGNRTYAAFRDNSNGTLTVDGHTFKYTAMKKRTVTMYDGLDCCLQKGCHSPAVNHNTLSGVAAQRGLVATYGIKSGSGSYISSLLPMGTIVFIEGYGLGVVADVHGVKSNPDLIDACFDAGEIRAGVASFGRMYARVYILDVP